MPNFPDRISEAIDPLRTAHAAGLERRAEAEVLKHGLRAWVVCKKDEIDSQTIRDAVETAFDEEVSFYDHGLAAADGSVAKQELLARKLEILSRSNNRRIIRRFS